MKLQIQFTLCCKNFDWFQGPSLVTQIQISFYCKELRVCINTYKAKQRLMTGNFSAICSEHKRCLLLKVSVLDVQLIHLYVTSVNMDELDCI